MPSKYRNVTSIYVNRFQRGGMLLDCGEGTLGQLTRRFGQAKVRGIVCGLACVWVSHIHADHHAGLPRSVLLLVPACCFQDHARVTRMLCHANIVRVVLLRCGFTIAAFE